MQYLNRGILVIVAIIGLATGYRVLGPRLNAAVTEVRTSEVHLDGPELGAEIAEHLDETMIANEVASRLKAQAWSERFRLLRARMEFCGYGSITIQANGVVAMFKTHQVDQEIVAVQTMDLRALADWMVNE